MPPPSPARPARLARLIVSLSAILAPRALRARWREEWLAELDARASDPLTSHGMVRRSLGAPWDALLLRATRWSTASLRFGWLADGRDAGRALRKSPLQTATIVACLAVGSTLTVLVFGVINAMIGGALPGVADRSQLVRVRVERASDRRIGAPLVADVRALPPAVTGITGFGAEIGAKPFSVSAGGQGGNADGAFVSGSYFSVLGTRPVLGRMLRPDDDRPDAPPVAVIGYHFWQRRFGGSAAALGSTIQVTSMSFQVVGVAPAGFTGLYPGDPDSTTTARRDVWMPIAHATRVGDGVVGRPGNATAVIARLDGRLARSEAEAVMQALVPRFNAWRASQQAPSSRPDTRGDATVAAVRLAPFHLLFADDDEPLANALLIATLASVPLIILGIACANVAGIQLARAIGRTHELAVRVSLGATRARVVRLLAIETGVVALGAAAIGWTIARELLRVAAGVLPIAPVADIRLLLFAVAVPLGVTLAAGVLPAWRATGFDVVSGLRLGPRVGRAASPRSRRLVVAIQLGLSVALLIGAGTLVRGLTGLPAAVGPAFDDVLVAEMRFWDLGWDEARERTMRQTIAERVRAMPGVEAVGLSPRSIFLGSNRGGDGSCRAGGTDTDGLMRLATPAFFDVLRLTMQQGRALRPGDDWTAVVINETFARGLLNPDAAIGSPIALSGRRTGTVVGVIKDNYERFPMGQPRAICYLAWNEGVAPAPNVESGSGYMTLYVRFHGAAELTPRIRGLLHDVDPRLGPIEIGTMAELMRTHYRLLYGMTSWLGVASAIALAMAAVGLFGIVAYGAAQRTHEFGVRLALGARPSDIGRALVRESIAVVIGGAVVGIALAAPVTWFLSRGLTSVRPADPVLGAGALVLLVLVSLAAAIRPIHRVAHINPVSALRAD